MLSSTGVAITQNHGVLRSSSHAAAAAPGSPSAVFETEIESFQTDLKNGPLLGLQAAVLPAIATVLPPAPSPTPAAIFAMEQTVSTAGQTFVVGVDGTVSRYITTVNTQVKRYAPGVARLLDLQATALEATETQWADRFQAGDYAFQSTSPSDWPYYYFKDSWTTITQLTASRPLWPLGTPALSLYQRADVFQHNLSFDVINMFSFINSGQSAFNKTIVDAHPYVVSRGETPQDFVSQIKDLAVVEAQAFQADYDASLTQQPSIRAMVNRTITSVKRALKAINLSNGDPAVQASAALSTFSSRIMTGNGLFGPQGPLRKSFQAPVNSFPNTPADYARLYTFTNAQVTKLTLSQADMTVSYKGADYAVFTRVNSDPVSAPPLPTYSPADPAPYLAALKLLKENNFYGSYLSTGTFTSSSAAIAADALDQSWFHPNAASSQVFVLAPVGTVVYQGTAAPIYQGLLRRQKTPSTYPGGAEQTVILNSRAQNVIYILTPTVVTNLATGATETLQIQSLFG